MKAALKTQDGRCGLAFLSGLPPGTCQIPDRLPSSFGISSSPAFRCFFLPDNYLHRGRIISIQERHLCQAPSARLSPLSFEVMSLGRGTSKPLWRVFTQAFFFFGGGHWSGRIAEGHLLFISGPGYSQFSSLRRHPQPRCGHRKYNTPLGGGPLSWGQTLWTLSPCGLLLKCAFGHLQCQRRKRL